MEHSGKLFFVVVIVAVVAIVVLVSDYFLTQKMIKFTKITFVRITTEALPMSAPYL